MIPREVFYPIARRAFWGYFLLLLDFNLTLNSVLCLPLLPNVLGWYLILQAARAGAEYRPTMKLLFPFCTALALYSLLQFLPAIEAMVPALIGLFVAVVTLYTHFQFFTDLAALAEDALPGEAAAGSLLHGRTVLVVSNTAFYAAGLLSDAPAILLAVGGAVMVVSFCCFLYILWQLWQLQRAAAAPHAAA